MNIVQRQGIAINKLRGNKTLVAVPIYKNIYTYETIYRLRLYDYEKRNKQRANNKRPHSWIYIYDADIAKALNINKNVFNSIMKYDSNALYSRDGGFHFNTEKECLNAIENIYNNLRTIKNNK